MSLQILGGKLKGIKLNTVDGKLVRPTSVMLRRKIFDARQILDGYSFVDFFAGSGAVGFEALSRGAEKVFFNEMNAKVFKQLKNNSKLIPNNSNETIINLSKMDAIKYLEIFKQIYLNYKIEQQKETILFVDPPYELHSLYIKILEAIQVSWYIGEIWIESDKHKGIAQDHPILDKFTISKVYNSSTQFVLFTKLKN